MCGCLCAAVINKKGKLSGCHTYTNESVTAASGVHVSDSEAEQTRRKGGSYIV